MGIFLKCRTSLAVTLHNLTVLKSDSSFFKTDSDDGKLDGTPEVFAKMWLQRGKGESVRRPPVFIPSQMVCV